MTVWNDEKVETIIGTLLRWGVILSATVVAIGGVVYLARHGREPASFSTFHGEPPELRGLWQMIRLALGGRGRGIIQLGLAILIATPVARVAFSVWAFERQRDWTYVWITFFVLAVLVYSLTGGA